MPGTISEIQHVATVGLPVQSNTRQKLGKGGVQPPCSWMMCGSWKRQMPTTNNQSFIRLSRFGIPSAHGERKKSRRWCQIHPCQPSGTRRHCCFVL